MRSWFACVLVCLFIAGELGALALANESGLSLPTGTDDPVVVFFENNDVDWTKNDPSKLLEIYVGHARVCCEDMIPMAGSYRRNGRELAFQPAFGLLPGLDYVVWLRSPDGKGGWIQEKVEFRIKPVSAPAGVNIVSVYPSGDVLPANVLRFYIHFSKPMQPHVAFDYIKLVDSSGAEDDNAFMRFKQELWSEDRTRLTVLMDPGRIKREVSSNLRLGPALREGEKLKLVIKEGWPAADGQSLLGVYSKSFAVSKALRQLPDTDQWEIRNPKVGTLDPLEIRFDRPFDYQLLHKDLRVLSDDGNDIPGVIHVGTDEETWRFVPDVPWRTREIELVVNSELEDVAGNNFKDLLDHTVNTETLGITHISIPIILNP